MTPDRARPDDDALASWMLAYDEALAAGKDPTPPPAPSAPDISLQAQEAEDCLRLLEKVWPRGASRPGSRRVSAGRPRTGPEPLVPAPPPTPAVSWAPGMGRLGRFQLLHELGRGGMGVVFLALDPRLGRRVALKVPHPQGLAHPDLRARFLREAQAAAGLDHPNVVPVYEAGEAGPICYIASAYCPGPTDRKSVV